MPSKTRKKKSKFVADGYKKVAIAKSFHESSKTFVSPDYSDKRTWYYNSVEVDDEVSVDSGDQKKYTFASGKTVIDLDLVTDRADWAAKGITVKKNDIEITTGFTVDTALNEINFTSANIITDVIKVSYSYENGSGFVLQASSGKKILLSYVETQFSEGTTLNDTMVFELILNNTSTSNTDVVLAKVEYKTAQDFLNKGNHGTVLRKFGNMTKDVNIFPWNYMTGFTLKPVGDDTTDPTKNEFNKIRMSLANDTPYTACEIATGTFYCFIEAL